MDFDFDFSESLFNNQKSGADGRNEVTTASTDKDWIFSSIYDDQPQIKQNCKSNAHKRKRVCSSDESRSSECHSICNKIDWTSEHAAIGKKIVNFFEINNKLQACVGEVVSYLPPSDSPGGDQLYRILYDDDDSEDFDQEEFEEGRRMFQTMFEEKK